MNERMPDGYHDMQVKAGYSTPLLHVSDVERSLHFYTRLGFETVDVHHDECSLVWARVHCEGGAIMFLRSEESDEAGLFPTADRRDA